MMNILQLDELKRKIKAGMFAPVYFVFGNEAYLINHYVNQIVNSNVTALPEVNLRVFDTNFDINEISSILYQVPMLSAKKCVVLNDFDLSAASQKDIETLLQVIENPSDVAILIFKYTTIELSFDKKGKASKPHKNYVTVAEAIDKFGGSIVNINHLTLGDTVKTLISGASKRGCVLLPDTAKYMIEYTSFDLTTLLCELEKVCSYVGEGNITKEIINKICTRSINSVIYDMAKAILANDANKSMQILENLLNQKHKETDILREISKSYIDIYRMHAAHNSNISVKTVADDFDYGFRRFVLNSSSTFAHKLSAKQLKLSLDAIQTADEMLKGGSKLKNGDALRMLIIKLVLISTKGELPC